VLSILRNEIQEHLFCAKEAVSLLWGVRKLIMLITTPGVDSVCFNASRLQHKCSWCSEMVVRQAALPVAGTWPRSLLAADHPAPSRACGPIITALDLPALQPNDTSASRVGGIVCCVLCVVCLVPGGHWWPLVVTTRTTITTHNTSTRLQIPRFPAGTVSRI
jgi:hypothetical protein